MAHYHWDKFQINRNTERRGYFDQGKNTYQNGTYIPVSNRTDKTEAEMASYQHKSALRKKEELDDNRALKRECGEVWDEGRG